MKRGGKRIKDSNARGGFGVAKLETELQASLETALEGLRKDGFLTG